MVIGLKLWRYGYGRRSWPADGGPGPERGGAFLPGCRARRRRVSRSLSERCRIVLRCAEGVRNKVVAAELGSDRRTVGKWRRRFVKDRLDGLSDAPRSGRPPTVGDDQVAQVIDRTLNTTPPDADRWSTRSMARESGLSQTTIRRIWRDSGLQPHRTETSKPSGGPEKS